MTLSRRDLLTAGLGLTAAACTSTSQPSTTPTSADGRRATDPSTTSASSATTELAAVDAPAFDGPSPFTLGIASGDPDMTSVVLWTRLLTDVDEPPPGADRMVAVDVAHDEAFTDLVHSSIAHAPADHGNSVHFLAADLEPDTWYWYRFRTGEHMSTSGRTRTTPASGDTPLRFAFSSCQNWESGAYGVHRALAETELDLFVWLGDYIYEYGPSNTDTDGTDDGRRVHNSAEVDSIEGYRARYALYKSDPHLQAHHANRPWLVTWDDHEVDNNYAGLATQDDQDGEAFSQRRKSAYQAWWENMPVRMPPPADDGNLRIYRSIRWGDLLDIHMLDGRQYRAPQPADGEPIDLPGVGNLGVRLLSETATDPAHTMLGLEQRGWLQEQVATSTATWNVLGNQVYMHGLNAFPGEVPAINTDSWDGYFGERKELLESITAHPSNVIILSGDFHAASAADVRANPFELTSPIVATEFMAPAISSAFPENLRGLAPLVLGVNPQVRHFSPENGYMSCEVTATTWTTELHLIADRTDENSPTNLAATLTVKAGEAGIASIS